MNTRYRWIFGVVCIIGAAVCGCKEPQVRDELDDLSLHRSSFVRLVKSDGTVAGYAEDSSTEYGRTIRFVFNSRLKKVGFITSHDMAYKFLPGGEKEKYGLFPDGGGEAALIGVRGPLTALRPDQELKEAPEHPNQGTLRKPEEKEN
jgi:hypothetical protein